MKSIIKLILISIVIFLSSCVPTYKCGEPIPNKKIIGSKKLKNLVKERDELCTNLAGKEVENAKLSTEKMKLNSDLTTLQNQHQTLNEKYNGLLSESSSQSDQYNKTLKEKSNELTQKEKLLADREKALKEMQQIITRKDSITNRLNDILRNALLGFNSEELSVEIKNGKVYVSMSDKLLFKSGSVAVESKGVEALQVLADVLNKNADIDILVEGHTDSIPIKTALFKDNWDLSVVRATSIVRLLSQDYKVSSTRVTASGKGEFFPKATNSTPEGRAKNRRTEIILSPKMDELMNLLNSK
ncbi:MAG: flagellar motor protein MotB [Flavobacteriales bacterium CG_4_10_14_0_2_um_filter_32_8]|nr:MAG: flagellar motor protein MotB [Flavobacteriales bacterium CG_4_10_14_0_2_um_filter_32_8]PJB14474.1 MAG: flagellar motor protein MotB [Flavobacteriales bacterium CG_4_9_14_3_um_filter_32_8]